jgi:excisionase family DNA binding protein
MSNHWLTVAEYAEHVGVTPQTVRRKCRQNRLPATQVNNRGDWLIAPSALRVGELAWLARRMQVDTSVVEVTATAKLLEELELPIFDEELLLAIERLQTSLERLAGRRA